MAEREPLPTPEPVVTPETQPYWDGTTSGRLVLPRCDRCEFVIWYPRSFCPRCGSDAVTWFDARAEGTVYSYTVCHRGSGDYRGHEPYVLAYVELADGPRVLTNLLMDEDAGPGGGTYVGLQIGAPVEAVFEPSSERAALLRFRLTTPAT